MNKKPLLELQGKMISKAFSVSDMATLLGVSVQTTYRKLNGKAEFTVDEARKIMNRLEIGIDVFFHE